jgi:hypothetical protein
MVQFGIESGASSLPASGPAAERRYVRRHGVPLKIIRFALFGLSGVLFVFAVILLVSDSGVSETIEHSRQIEASFKEAHAFVNDWQSSHGRLPSVTEFEHWANRQPDHAYGPRGIQISIEAFPQEVLTEFGEPSSGAYLFSLWRGEWTEYDPSWSPFSSLIFDKSQYFILGSAFLDSGAISGFGVLILLLARATGRRAA